MTAHYAIAGACSDLGTGLAWRLSALGYPLVLIDEDVIELEKLSDALVASGYALPALAVITPLGHDFEQQCNQLAQATPTLCGLVWAGAWLDNPTPLLQESLTHWQQGMIRNVTLPLTLIKALYPALTRQAIVWLAQPQALPFTNQLGAATSLWSAWIPTINQELGRQQNQRIKLWQLPRIADRVHRRIFPLSPIEDFTPIDHAIDAWLLTWENPT
jgi:NAD(P)-dependent dehydrogenase (short-subunit alcohol dehydrogenase family)